MSDFKTYIPKVKILNKTILGGDYNLGEFVKRANGNSSLDQPANTVVIELMPNKETSYPGYIGVNSVPFWLKTIKKNDLISVGIDSENSFLYKIDGIYRQKTVSQNGADIGIRIIGRSLVSVLLDDDITFAPDLAHNGKSIKLLGALRSTFLGFIDGLRGLIGEGESSQFLAQHPLASVLWILLNMPAVNAKIFYVDYDDKGNPLGKIGVKTVGALFDFDFMAYEKDLLFDPQLNMYTGKVWNYIMQCIDPMFYEVYDETRIKNGVPRSTIIIRPKPFDRTTDNERILGDTILRMRVEREGDVNKGDFNIKTVKRTLGEQTAEVYEVTLKGFKDMKFQPDSTVERVNLKWDNQNVTGDLENAFKTCVTNELYHTVPETEDYECNVGSTTQDVVNFITMHAIKDMVNGDELAKWGLLFPLVDCYSLLQYGCRRMEGRTLMMHALSPSSWKDSKHAEDYTGVPDGAVIYPLSEAVKQRDRLLAWYRFNPMFLSGTARVLGHDYYRKGDKIFFPQHFSEDGYYGVFYYIQGVNWRFEISQAGASYLSYLSIVRGENSKSIDKLKYEAGYDLYDQGYEEDPNPPPGEKPRLNPILRIDAALVPTPPVSAGVDRRSDNIDGKVNPTFDGTVDGNGDDRLTQTSRDSLSNGYDKHVQSDGTYGSQKVSKQQVVDAVYKTARDNGINPNIIVALIYHESVGWNPKAVSPTNAVGLGQHMGFEANKKFFSKPIAEAYKKPLADDGRYNAIENILGVGKHLKNDKGWSSTLDSKIKALNGYYGEGGSNPKSVYIGRLKIPKFLPNTEIK